MLNDIRIRMVLALGLVPIAGCRGTPLPVPITEPQTVDATSPPTALFTPPAPACAYDYACAPTGDPCATSATPGRDWHAVNARGKPTGRTTMGGPGEFAGGVTDAVRVENHSQNYCCYAFTLGCMGGRLYRVGGEPVTAETCGTSSWISSTYRSVNEVDDRAPCVEVGESWLRAAQMEHASIGSFAQLALDLLALGAPPSLVRRAHEAATDEVRHAILAFSEASRWLRKDVGPSEMPTGFRAMPTIATLVRETLSDGCLGETVAACLGREVAEQTDDAEAAALHAGIADDEMRHAELAFAILAWAFQQDRAAVVPVVDEVLRALQAMPDVPRASDPLLRWGRWTEATEAHWMSRVAKEVVIPSLRELVAFHKCSFS